MGPRWSTAGACGRNQPEILEPVRAQLDVALRVLNALVAKLPATSGLPLRVQ